MGWTLRLVETGKKTRSRRKDVFEFGDIDAPCDLDTVGLSMTHAKDVLAALQQHIVVLQAEALATKARAAVRSTPHLQFKGYRVRHLDTLFGRIALKLPRLVSRDPEREPPCLVIKRKWGTMRKWGVGAIRPSMWYSRFCEKADSERRIAR